MAFLSDVSRLLRELQGGERGNQPEPSHSQLRRPSLPVSRGNRFYAEPFSAALNGDSPNIAQYPYTPEQHRLEMSSSPAMDLASSPTFKASRTKQIQRQNPVLRAMTREHPPESSGTHHAIRDPRQIGVRHAPPFVQGIPLVSPHELPDKFRSIFPYPTFNAVQSKCFAEIFDTDENFVLSAPTGSGKTGVLELAICRLAVTSRSDSYKIVYMAPTKSLCAERQRDWQNKFAPLSIQCAELTGDTDRMHLRQVQSATLIVTTPEKWDSMTRKWKDHARLMQMVKLLLIDEVHMLKEARGATLEAVVSRMKSIGTDVRFIALSATVPNSEDIATWLGLHSAKQGCPAHVAKFGEEFRPVKLQKFVCGISYKGNDFGAEGVCDKKLPELVARYSRKKPIMVFCFTRKSCLLTAKLLANIWDSKGPRDRPWPSPTRRVVVQEPELKDLVTSGVAFHHAGIHVADRHAIEKGYLEGQIHVICCTSTLAVGVNLPCHMVIIKNTVCYHDDGIKEYSDLEMMQMLGRAGRPQFDDSAVAVIITKEEKKGRYERLVAGQDVLESCLHLNLIEHLNVEIGLGTVFDVNSAKRWLAGTFLAVRLQRNPSHYKLGDEAQVQDLQESISQICRRDISLLEDHDIVRYDQGNNKLRCTEFGEAMSRYYVKFETMKVFLGLEPRAKISDILSLIMHADEYHEVRIRAAEKRLFKEINGAIGVRYPIKVDIALHAHKRSLILQSELGGVDFPVDEHFGKHRRQYQIDKTIIFTHVHRLVRCIIDCQVHLQDSVAVRNALELARSFGAGVWDNSPLQMKQIQNIGPVAVRKLAMAGINSLEALEATEACRIEHLLGKNPPFGSGVLSRLKDFPKLRVSLKILEKDVKTQGGVRVKVKAECGFMNEQTPLTFRQEQIFVCVLLERSDGLLVDFRRISAKQLGTGQDLIISTEMKDHLQYLTSYVMCEEIAGTMRHAEIRFGLPASSFPLKAAPSLVTNEGLLPVSQALRKPTAACQIDDEFDDGIDETDMANSADAAVKEVIGTSEITHQPEVHTWKPLRLRSGKWACNHQCKVKTKCKHLCCREGLDKPPKAPRTQGQPPGAKKQYQQKLASKNEQVPLVICNPQAAEQPWDEHFSSVDEEGKDISQSAVPIFMHAEQEDTYGSANKSHLPISRHRPPRTQLSTTRSSGYDESWIDDLPSPSTLIGRERTESTQSQDDADFGCEKRLDHFRDNLKVKDSGTEKGAEDEFLPGPVENEAGNVPWENPVRVDPQREDVIQTPFISDDKLFLSTDVPKENLHVPQEQLLEHEVPPMIEDEQSDHERPRKKSRIEVDVANPQRQSSQVPHDRIASITPELPIERDDIITTSSAALPSTFHRPAWVDSFDPAFIAEWQDIVEFVD